MNRLSGLCRLAINVAGRRTFRFSAVNMELKPLLMASLSPTMDKGNIVAWNFKEGDLVEAGSSICDIETDKAIVGLDAIDDTILVKIVKPAGSKDIALGELIGWTADKNDDISNLKIPDSYTQEQEAKPASRPAESKPSPAAAPPAAEEHQEVHHDKVRFKASPAVRALISKHNIDPSNLKATGPRGTITKSDVEDYLSKGGAHGATTETSDFTEIPVTTVRGIVASRLALSKRTIPHEYCSADCFVDELTKLRAKLKESGQRVSVNDFIVKAAALTLKLVPEMNGIYQQDKAMLNDSIDVAVAVSIPDGLITPVVRQADKVPLTKLSGIIKDLAERARTRKLAPEQFQGSTFTVSNLGMFGVDSFCAVINPPELAILAVGGTRAVTCPELRQQMTVTLSYDSRAVTPVMAAKFLQYFRGFIENPALLQIE